MGQRLPLADDTPFLLQIKALNDSELLDFWAETQHIETLVRNQFDQEILFSPDYERLILFELQLRSCQRGRAACP
jgi:hypothetical protein